MPHKNDKNSGSRQIDEPEFLLLGKLRRAHGVKGEIPLEVYTEMMELLVPGSLVFIGETHQPYTIERTRWKQALLLLKFKEIDDRTIVSALTNEQVFVKSTQLPSLSDDEIYSHQMIGLQVFYEDGVFLGVLEEILETGANDVFVIKDDSGEEILIPDIDGIIIQFDLENNKMVVARMDWYGEGD